MLLSEALQILKENKYIVEYKNNKSLNEDILSMAGDAFNLFMPGILFIYALKAIFRGIGSHFDTKKLKEILKKCENNKDDFAAEIVELLQKKVIHRPITDLNDDELSESIEKLLNNFCGYHSIHIDNDDLTTHVYNDEGYGTIKDKIKKNLDAVYEIVFDLMFNLVKYHFETNPNKTKMYEYGIQDSCEKIYYITTKMGNLRRASYMMYKGTNGEKGKDYLSKYINKKKLNNHLIGKTYKND